MTATQRPNPNPSIVERKRRLAAVWTAVGVSTFGDGAFLAAVPLAAAAVTRDPTAVAAVAAASFIPWVIVQPFAGALMDRWPLRTVMLTADIARAAGVTVLAALVATGAATIPILAVVACAVVVGQIFHDTAVQGVVPTLAGREGADLDRANGRIYGAETAGKQLLGPPAGSATYVLAPWLPFAADAVSFAASAALLSRLPREPAVQREGIRPPLVLAVKAGTLWLARHRQLRTLALVAASANIAYHISWATFVLLALDPNGLGMTPAAFGLLFAAYAIGGVIGGPLTRSINSHFGAQRTVLGLTAVHAVTWPLIAVTGTVWVAAPALALIGLAQTVTTTTNVGLRQLLVPPAMLSRVISAFRWVVNAPTPLAALVGGAVATAYGLGAPLVVAGVFLMAAAAVAAVPLLRSAARREELD